MFGKSVEKIEISQKTIVFTVLFLIGIWVTVQISGILILIFIAFILMTAFNPFVNTLQKIKVPRSLAIFLVFLIILSIISGIVAGVIPVLVSQIGVLLETLRSNFPDYKFFNFEFDQSNIAGEVAKQIEMINKNLNNIFKVISSTASGIISLVTVMVLTVYFLAERPQLDRDLKSLFNNESKEKEVKEMFERIEKIIGGWIRGEFFLMVVVGTLTYLGLLLLGIPFALPLAIIAGILELIPNLGPTLSAIPGILAGLTISFPVAVGTLVLYIAVQQLENNLIVPLIMKKSVNINPIITMIILMAGAKLGGITGAILGIPLFLTAREMWRKR